MVSKKGGQMATKASGWKSGGASRDYTHQQQTIPKRNHVGTVAMTMKCKAGTGGTVCREAKESANKANSSLLDARLDKSQLTSHFLFFQGPDTLSDKPGEIK